MRHAPPLALCTALAAACNPGPPSATSFGAGPTSPPDPGTEASSTTRAAESSSDTSAGDASSGSTSSGSTGSTSGGSTGSEPPPDFGPSGPEGCLGKISVGALMYVLLTRCEVDFGEPDEPLEVLPPAVLVPGVSQALSDVVMRALAPADHRYPSATDMAEAIRKALPEREPPAADHRHPSATDTAEAIRKALPKREPPARAGIPGRAALAGMALAAVVAVLGTVTAQRALGTTAMPIDAEPASVMQPPALVSPPTKLTEPTVELVSPEPPAAAAPAPPTAELVSPESSAAAAPAKATRATWETVKRKVKRRAAELAPCSEDEFIFLGLHVIGGRAVLETVDGKPTSEKHTCARDVVARLRFAGGELRGVVGVPLPLD